MFHRLRQSRWFLGIGLLLGATFIWPSPTAAAGPPGAAEIVHLIGKGERRPAETAPWTSAAVKDQVSPGAFVRTLANSQMGLLFPDRTQMRLNQNSQLQIKSAAEAAEWTQTNVKLNAGRAWSQARPQAAPSAPANVPKVSMETPSATMSIRGTDWEVEVLPDGTTQLVVLSGTVQITNDHGAATVESGEAARAAPGQAPAKFQLLNPRQRVQWVSSWQPQPRRWAQPPAHADAVARIEAGEYDAALKLLAPREAADAAAAMLAADVRMSQGEFDQAIRTLTPHSREPAAAALLARALARADRVAEARALIERSIAVAPRDPQLLLAAGELAILDGDAGAARKAFGAAIEQQAQNAEAWYGLGLVESERENVRAARDALDRALTAAPGSGTAQAERAAVETFAGNLAEARKRLEELLAREPANYIALTAYGITLLKSGKAEEALEAFLKAGTIEPRYARAWLYSGAAFYQLGDRQRAIEAFRKAAELDPRDPVPHLLESLALTDRLEYGAAIEAAQRAQERMPYLKSLNQVANDQKGSANLGSALAYFGMEEWAASRAYEAYSPFWAGSHFFLADRYTGLFNKNSELFQGYVTDPTAFGASNRYSTMVTAPGHYGKLEGYYERSDWRQGSLIGTVNGLVVEPIPVAYFASGDFSATRSREDQTAGDGNNFTLGLGALPRHDLGLFVFGTDTRLRSDLRTPTLPDDNLDLRDQRADFGATFKLSALNQFWLKAGTGSQSSKVSGTFVSSSLGNITLDNYKAEADQNDVQFRHSIGFGAGHSFTWGVEYSTLERSGEFVFSFPPIQARILEDQSVRSTDFYVSARLNRLGPFGIQGDLWYQRADIDRTDSTTCQGGGCGPLTVLDNNVREAKESDVNPRLGVAWYMPDIAVLRAVGQRWRRPASVGTLGPVDTLGVPVNDRLPVPGGLYTRGRLQLDRESSSYFVQAFADRERVDNGIGGIRSVVPSLDLTQLESLRQRRDVFTAVPDLEATPEFAEGAVDTAGVAGNVLVSANQSLAARYLNRHGVQSGTNDGLKIPYIPRHMLRIASQWTLPQRFLVGANATYRSERFRDDLNTDPIRKGWAFGLLGYWETSDKRLSFQAVLENLLSDKAAGLDSHAKFTARLAYRL